MYATIIATKNKTNIQLLRNFESSFKVIISPIPEIDLLVDEGNTSDIHTPP
jgi:hypothetical protein